MISGRTSNLRESGVAYLFLAPGLLFIVVFIAYPLVYSFISLLLNMILFMILLPSGWVSSNMFLSGGIRILYLL